MIAFIDFNSQHFILKYRITTKLCDKLPKQEARLLKTKTSSSKTQLRLLQPCSFRGKTLLIENNMGNLHISVSNKLYDKQVKMNSNFNFGESWLHGMTPSDVTTFFPVKECSWAFISLTERALFCFHWAYSYKWLSTSPIVFDFYMQMS